MPYLQEQGVTWFEEPVSSDDLDGLRLIRDHGAGDVQVSAGEYGYHTPYFRDMLAAGAVDVLQADATRCSGISGFLEVSALCDAFQVPLSSHTAPSVHLHAACAAQPLRHIEWFHDHVRIEQLFFDGAARAEKGYVTPDLSRPGLGIELKSRDAQRYAI
jgi:L-alanine-DL-glutamate epimerase-like enolase superfamily enzyme